MVYRETLNRSICKEGESMSKQRINELGSSIRRLHHEIMDATIEEMTTGVYSKEADMLDVEFKANLLELIGIACDAQDTISKLLGAIKEFEREAY